jgi:hypothetical protein
LLLKRGSIGEQYTRHNILFEVNGTLDSEFLAQICLKQNKVTLARGNELCYGEAEWVSERLMDVLGEKKWLRLTRIS